MAICDRKPAVPMASAMASWGRLNSLVRTAGTGVIGAVRESFSRRRAPKFGKIYNHGFLATPPESTGDWVGAAKCCRNTAAGSLLGHPPTAKQEVAGGPHHTPQNSWVHVLTWIQWVMCDVMYTMPKNARHWLNLKLGSALSYSLLCVCLIYSYSFVIFQHLVP